MADNNRRDRDRDRDRRNFKVVKMGTEKTFVDRQLGNIITELTKKCSIVAILGALNLHAKAYTWARDNNNDALQLLFPANFNHKHVAPIFREVYVDNTHIKLTLTQMGLFDELIGDLTAHGQIIMYLAKDYTVNFKNNVVFSHRRWLKLLFQAYCRMGNTPDPTVQNMKSTLDYLCHPPIEGLADPTPDQQFIDFLVEYFQLEINGKGYFAAMKEEWGKFVPFFIQAQLYVYRYNVEENQKPADDQRKVKTNRVIPQLTWHRHHITLDTRCLKQILNVHCNTKYTDGNYLAHSTEIWQRVFKFDQLTAVQRQQFHNFVKTDGFAVSFTLQKNLPDDDDDDDYDDDDMEVDESDPDCDSDSDNDWNANEFFIKRSNQLPKSAVIFDPIVNDRLDADYYRQFGGCDFGIVNMYAVVLDCEDGEKVIKTSNSTYKYRTQNRQWKDRETEIAAEFLRYDRDIQLQYQQLYGEMPSAKSEMIENYVSYKLHTIKMATDVYMSEEYVKIQFAKWQVQKSVLATQANEIANGVPTLLFVGAPPVHQNCPIRGHLRPPLHKQLGAFRANEWIDVVITNENLSSQLCRYCRIQGGFANNGRTFHCKQCTANNGRSMTMDRDVNAAANIKNNGLYAIQNGGMLPPAFRHGQ